MKLHSKIIFILIIAFSGLLTYCIKQEEYSIIPSIRFQSLTQVPLNSGADSLVLVLSFTDGDGDIGVNQSDQTSTNKDIFITYLRRWNGKLTDTTLTCQNIKGVITLNSWLPYITPQGKNKNIQGTIQYGFSIPCQQLDTISFQVYITDRASHKSNVIITPEIVLQN